MNPANKKKEKASPFSPAVALAVVIVALGGTAFWYLEKSGPPAQQALVLTPEASVYMPQLKLFDVEMKATESYVGNAVIEINGKIQNNGDKHVKQVDLHCVFYDPYRQMVLREPVVIVKAATGGIKPGETKTFRLPFDNLPQSWDKSMPALVVKQITFF